MAPIPPPAIQKSSDFVSLHSQGVQRRSSQTIPPPNASTFVEIRVDNDDDDDSDDEFDSIPQSKDTDSLIPRRSSSTSAVPASHSRRASNSTFNGLPAIGEKRDGVPLTGGYLLYTSVLITVLLGRNLDGRSRSSTSELSTTPGIARRNQFYLASASYSPVIRMSTEKYGRRFIVIGDACLMILGAEMQTFAPNIFVLALGRFFSGIAPDSGSMITSLYLGEMGPSHQRAGFVIAFQCTGSMGLVAITIAHFAVTGSPTS